MSFIGYPRTLKWSDFFAWKTRPAWSSVDTEAAFTTVRIVPPATYPPPIKAAGKFKLAPFDVEVKVAIGGSNTWVIDGMQTADLLDHEQGHLDIAGLVAQELFNALQELQDSSAPAVTTAANKIVKDIGETKHEKLQQRYDKETQNGTEKAKHAKWNKKFKDSKASLGSKKFILLT